MSPFPSPDGGKHLPMWGRCICVLLVGLLLYNPFAALTRASDGLAYDALARHRATVGASEMQHFAPVKIQVGHVHVSIATKTGELPAPREEARPARGRVHLPLLLEGIASLWFRPPPRA